MIITTMGDRWRRRKEKFTRSWNKLMFNLALRNKTITLRSEVLRSAELALENRLEHESELACLSSSDPVVQQGWIFKQRVEIDFLGKYSTKDSPRILIQIPRSDFSPAGYSLFTNLLESLHFIGVTAAALGWDDDTAESLEKFQPTVFLSSDHSSYLERIDWEAVAQYKRRCILKVGLTASLEEYDNTPLSSRLEWAGRHQVDFFYTFRDEGYVTTRAAYEPFFQRGYRVLYIPFGANVLHYFPVSGFERNLDFAIMASRKSEHMSYMRSIVRHHDGFIDGPGWKHIHQFNFKRERDRYIYARAKVGLNVHLPEQLEWACELNERTYQLAACGVPQLIDHPLLLDKVFSPQALYVADSPKEYGQLFLHALSRPDERTEKALLAQKEVFERHTTLHRADAFLNQLNEFVSN